MLYGGGLYAGGIAGIKLVTRNPCKNLVVFTVGLADPDATDYSAIINQNIPPELLTKTKVFHFRGGIDYKQLGPVHKVMMAMMKNMIQKKSDSERNAEDKEFLKTYDSQVNFSDRQTMEPLVAYVNRMGLAGGCYTSALSFAYKTEAPIAAAEQTADLAEMLVDQAYRMTLLELGVM